MMALQMMLPRSLPALLLTLAASNAFSAPTAASAPAAPATYQVEDYSTAGLMDKATAMAVWKEGLPEQRLAKLFPKAKWGFLSQVEGGLVNGQTCVVTARVAMLPKTSPTRRLVWEPSKMSTTFDGKTVANAAECSALAKDKLQEAVRSLVSSLVK
jgi:hypothetical protein